MKANQLKNALGRCNTAETPLSLRTVMDRMDSVARESFRKLVLFSECSNNTHAGKCELLTSGAIDDTILLEFCGLCQSAVRLPLVLEQ